MITDTIRGIIWGLGSIVLGICDVCFALLKTVSMIDVTSFGSLWSMWTILTAFVSMFILFKVAKIWAKILSNEDYRDKVKPEIIIFRFIPIVLVLSLLPILVSYVGEGSTHFVKNISTFVGVSEEQQISETIINASSYSGSIQDHFESNENNEVEVTYTFAEVDKDINAKKNGKYMFFPTYGSMFAGIGMGLFMAYILIFLVIEVSKRLFSIGAKILISPIPIAGLIDPDDNSFGKWLRSIGTDFIANFIQIYMVYFTVIFANSTMIRETGMFAQFFLMSGGLLFSLHGVPALADIIGVDISGTTALSSLAQIGQTRMGFGGIGAALGGAALTTAAIGGHSALKMSNGGFNMLANSNMGQNMGLNPTSLTTAKAGLASKNMKDQLKASKISPFNETNQKNVVAGQQNPGEASYAGTGKIGGALAKLDNVMVERISRSKAGRMTSRVTGWGLEKVKGFVQGNSDINHQTNVLDSSSSSFSTSVEQGKTQSTFSSEQKTNPAPFNSEQRINPSTMRSESQMSPSPLDSKTSTTRAKSSAVRPQEQNFDSPRSSEVNRVNEASKADPFASYRQPKQPKNQENQDSGVVKRFDSNGRNKPVR